MLVLLSVAMAMLGLKENDFHVPWLIEAINLSEGIFGSY